MKNKEARRRKLEEEESHLSSHRSASSVVLRFFHSYFHTLWILFITYYLSHYQEELDREWGGESKPNSNYFWFRLKEDKRAHKYLIEF